MDAAPRPSDERCARCGGAFHCGRGDATPCACSQVQLGAALLARLRAEYTGCLCLPCLQALAAAGPEAADRGP